MLILVRGGSQLAMVDTLRTGTKAAETIIGGMAGGVAYSIINDDTTLMYDIKWVFVVSIALIGLFVLLHWYYEWKTGEPYH